MNDTAKKMEEGFDEFMDHYREMDADEFIKELEEAGVSFVQNNEKSDSKDINRGIEEKREKSSVKATP